MTGFPTSSPTAAPASAPASSNGHTGRRAGQAVGLPTRQHPRGYAALAVALIVAFSALGYWFYSQAGAKVPVVVAVHDIPVGHTITRSELSTTEVSGGIVAVAGNHLDSLVGQVAAVEILPNTLVQRSMVSTGVALSPSQAVVGVAVGPGQLPSSGLRPGDKVEVLGLPQKGAAPSGSTVLAASVVVSDVRGDPAAPGGTLVSLLVDKPAAAPIAAASDAGVVALVRVGG